MSITTIGSLGNYMRNFKLQTQWQMKKQSGDLTNQKKKLQKWVDETTLALEKLREEAKEKNTGGVDVKALYTKIQNGKKLSAGEMDYLRTHDPQMYEKVKNIEREKQAYEEEIKRCKTKDDVQRAKFNRISTSLATVKSVENNPNIPLSAKLGIAMAENAKIKAIEEITLKFVESGEYAKLPTEAEYAEAMEELNEQRKPEAVQNEEEKTPEEKKEEADAAVSGEIVNADVGEKTTSVDAAKKPDDSEKNIEVESEELKKAKRAKAKAAYQKIGSEWGGEDASAFVGTASFDAKG